MPREGIVCLEVKGGACPAGTACGGPWIVGLVHIDPLQRLVLCRDGVWRTVDRWGDAHELPKSPGLDRALEDWDPSLPYVGMSRARSLLVLIVHERTRDALQRRIRTARQSWQHGARRRLPGARRAGAPLPTENTYTRNQPAVRENDLAEQTYRERWENPPADCRLEAPARFADEHAAAEVTERLCPGVGPDEMGPDARTVREVLAGCCAGWARHPSSREFYDAIRAETPCRRQRHLIRTWGSEASVSEIILAWAQRAYTMRELVAALRRADFGWPRRIQTINRWIER